jgi:hypothetical protein
MDENKSELARLMQQITMEYQAAERGLNGLASGSATHACIAAKMERMSNYQKALSEFVGPHEAIILLAQATAKAREEEQG